MKFNKMLIKIERYLPLVLMCIFIFIQSSRKAVVVSYDGNTNFLAHKLAHVIVYILLFLASVRALKDFKRALVFTILYGISDEVHQMFVQTRTASFRDVIIDSCSAFVTYFLVTKYLKKLPLIIRKFFDL
jgi:VanZ family protein